MIGCSYGASVPAPEAYEYANHGDGSDVVGVGYIVSEKLPGKPMTWYDITEDQKQSFSRQPAHLHIQPNGQSFGKLGLRPGPPWQRHHAQDRPCSTTIRPESLLYGPFEHSEDYYKGFVQRGIRLVATRQRAISAPVDLVWYTGTPRSPPIAEVVRGGTPVLPSTCRYTNRQLPGR